jgi:hypothetical protein
MKKRGPTLLCSMILSTFVSSLFAELPDFYQKVNRIVWIVDNLDEVTQGWEKLGFPDISQHGEVVLNGTTFRNQQMSVSLLAATGQIGTVKIDWLEPLCDGNAFSEFLKENGPGVFALVHHVPIQELLELEVVRYSSLGVGLLQSGSSSGPLNWGHYIFLDTAPDGKIVLGLMSSQETPLQPAFSQTVPFDQAIAQYAFAVQNPVPVSKFWESLGFPAFTIVPVEGRQKEYKGRPATFEMNLGWQRHGDVPFEWCIPLKGPTVYQDHMEQHGEGFHHLGLRVDDLDSVIEKWEALGISVTQSGAWGEEERPGSGRYAYMDTDSLGGIAIELLWSFRAKD